MDIERRDDWIHREFLKLDRILRGDDERNIKGLIETLNHLENEINKFNRIFDKDYLGHGGLVSFITYLHDREKDRMEPRTYKWAFWGTILAALLGLLTAGLTHRDDVMKWFPKMRPYMTEKPKQQKVRRHHVTRPKPLKPPEPPETQLPETDHE